MEWCRTPMKWQNTGIYFCCQKSNQFQQQIHNVDVIKEPKLWIAFPAPGVTNVLAEEADMQTSHCTTLTSISLHKNCTCVVVRMIYLIEHISWTPSCRWEASYYVLMWESELQTRRVKVLLRQVELKSKINTKNKPKTSRTKLSAVSLNSVKTDTLFVIQIAWLTLHLFSCCCHHTVTSSGCFCASYSLISLCLYWTFQI